MTHPPLRVVEAEVGRPGVQSPSWRSQSGPGVGDINHVQLLVINKPIAAIVVFIVFKEVMKVLGVGGLSGRLGGVWLGA